MNAQPLPAPVALDAYFLEARCRLLDIAAILDRVGRGPESAAAALDPRLSKIRKAIQVLAGPERDRAERIQQIFSQEYDAGWKIPTPR